METQNQNTGHVRRRGRPPDPRKKRNGSYAIGLRVQIRRAELGMTQAQLGRKAKIQTGEISALEGGRTGSITSWKVAALARAMNVTADWLLGL